MAAPLISLFSSEWVWEASPFGRCGVSLLAVGATMPFSLVELYTAVESAWNCCPSWLHTILCLIKIFLNCTDGQRTIGKPSMSYHVEGHGNSEQWSTKVRNDMHNLWPPKCEYNVSWTVYNGHEISKLLWNWRPIFLYFFHLIFMSFLLIGYTDWLQFPESPPPFISWLIWACLASLKMFHMNMFASIISFTYRSYIAKSQNSLFPLTQYTLWSDICSLVLQE